MSLLFVVHWGACKKLLLVVALAAAAQVHSPRPATAPSDEQQCPEAEPHLQNE